jgi:hypothetical protein
MDKDSLYMKLYNFRDLPMDEQGQIAVKLAKIIDRVEDGVWYYSHQMRKSKPSQCAFCLNSPTYGHDEDCPVQLTRDLRDSLS